MLDIALTNDTTFADVVEVLGGVIDIADIVNAIYRLNEPAWALPADVKFSAIFSHSLDLELRKDFKV